MGRDQIGSITNRVTLLAISEELCCVHVCMYCVVGAYSPCSFILHTYVNREYQDQTKTSKCNNKISRERTIGEEIYKANE